MRKFFILNFILLFFPLICAAQIAPKAVIENISAPTVIGESDLKVWGLKVYHIALWGENKKFSYDEKFAIQIHYNMNFSKEDLAKRSIDEIKRLHKLSPQEEESYYNKLKEVFVSVKKGDEKVALFNPKSGVILFRNNEVVGKISDPKLARLFVDIWLDERGSYPKVTGKILGKNN